MGDILKEFYLNAGLCRRAAHIGLLITPRELLRLTQIHCFTGLSHAVKLVLTREVVELRATESQYSKLSPLEET